MKMKMRGRTMAIVGYALIIFNAASYLFDWGSPTPVSSIIGLILVTIGFKRARQGK